MDKFKSQENPLKTLMGYAGNHKYLVMIGRTLAALSALVAMVPYYNIWKIIQIAVSGEHPERITPLAWQAVGITVIGMLMYIAALMCDHIAAFRVQANMRIALMEHIATLPLGVFDKEGTGKIRRIVNESTAATETYIAHTLADKAVASFTPIGLLALMLIFSWKLGLICLIPAVFGFIAMSLMMMHGMQTKMKEYQNSLETMSNEAVEYVRGIPVVKTFGQTIYSFKRFSGAINDYEKWVVDYTLSLRSPMTLFMTAINSIFVFLILSAYLFTKDGITAKTLLDIMFYVIITPLLTVTLTKIAYSGEAEMTVLDALGRMKTIFEMKSLDLVEKLNTASNVDISSAQENLLTLKNVTYRYAGAERDALKDVSLTIGKGQQIAFVGPSGGGKTTLAELISRFFDVTSGEILLAGKNIKDIPLTELMKLISFVFQDSKLIKTSILENVRLAKPEATETEVLAALEKAQCIDIINKLPNGINTVIGSKGTYLSGGEMQRISIARAFLKDAPILILDEATAFADPDNETKVQGAFAELAKSKTVIMIAHRLTTVTNADHIFVLSEGNLVEDGNHASLMSQNGLYKKMFDEYQQSIEWKVGA